MLRRHWKLPAFMCRAAPTCTLYRADVMYDILVFRFWPHFVITYEDVVRAG